MSLARSEPVTLTALINAGGAAGVAVAVGFFGWEPNELQVGAIASVQMFVILALGAFTRNRVTPVDNVALTHDDVALIHGAEAMEEEVEE